MTKRRRGGAYPYGPHPYPQNGYFSTEIGLTFRLFTPTVYTGKMKKEITVKIDEETMKYIQSHGIHFSRVFSFAKFVKPKRVLISTMMIDLFSFSIY